MVRGGVLPVASDEGPERDGPARHREAELPLREVAKATLERGFRVRTREAVALGTDLLAHDASGDRVADVPGHAVAEPAAEYAMHADFDLPRRAGGASTVRALGPSTRPLPVGPEAVEGVTAKDHAPTKADRRELPCGLEAAERGRRDAEPRRGALRRQMFGR